VGSERVAAAVSGPEFVLMLAPEGTRIVGTATTYAAWTRKGDL
jgi:hypothetical protein